MLKEARVKAADGSSTNTTTNYAKDGTTILSKTTEQVSASGQTRTELMDADGNTTTDTRVTHQITTAAGVTTTAIGTYNQDNTLRYQEKEVLASNGRDKVISRDKDGNGAFETVENLTVTLNPDTTRTNVLTVKNADGTSRTITSYTQSADTFVGVAGNENRLLMVVAA